jgi:hypothetical protein
VNNTCDGCVDPKKGYFDFYTMGVGGPANNFVPAISCVHTAKMRVVFFSFVFLNSTRSRLSGWRLKSLSKKCSNPTEGRVISGHISHPVLPEIGLLQLQLINSKTADTTSYMFRVPRVLLLVFHFWLSNKLDLTMQI